MVLVSGDNRGRKNEGKARRGLDHSWDWKAGTNGPGQGGKSLEGPCLALARAATRKQVPSLKAPDSAGHEIDKPRRSPSHTKMVH